MFKDELKKYIGKAAVLFVIFGIGYFLMLLFDHTFIEERVRQHYEEYIDLLEGPLTAEKEAYIAEEYERINAVLEKTNNIQDGEPIDFDKVDYALEHEMAWQMIYDRYINLLKAENAEDQVFYSDLDMQDFFQSSQINYFEIFLLIIVALYAVAIDFQEGRNVIIKTTYKGNIRYIVTKQNVLICMAVSLSVLFSFIDFIYIVISGNLSMLTLPIKSMVYFSDLEWSMSIGEYMLLRGMNHIIWCVVTILLMCMLGLLIKKLQTSLFVGLSTIVIPLALRGLFDKKLFVWIYSVHLNKDFTLCNFDSAALILAGILIITIYGLNILLWKMSRA